MIKQKSMFELLPDALLDDDGYPTTQWLEYIRNYKPDYSISVLQFVKSVLVDGWHYSDLGFKIRRSYKGKVKLELHTGGWSGNEHVINAIKSNIYLTHFDMRYVMWRAGGHYYFEISTK